MEAIMFSKSSIHFWVFGALTGVFFFVNGIKEIHAASDATAERPQRADSATDVMDANELVETGRTFYARRCGACHSIDTNRIGPRHRGVHGRVAGSLTDYNYSAALRGADIIWDEETLLSLFHKGPDVYLPGTKMPMQRIPRRNDLVQLIDYMRELIAASSGR